MKICIDGRISLCLLISPSSFSMNLFCIFHFFNINYTPNGNITTYETCLELKSYYTRDIAPILSPITYSSCMLKKIYDS